MTKPPVTLPDLSGRPRSNVVRRGLTCLLVVAGLLAVRLTWGWYANGAVQARVETLRARGEPILAEDFPFVAVPDAENAFKYQTDAAAAAVPNANPPRATNMVYPPYPPYDAAWMAAAESSERAHGKLFALAREARRHTRVQVSDKPIPTPLAMAWRGNLNAIRHLTNVLADGATLAHARGNDAEAVERIRDLLHLARSIRHDDIMISQLVATGLEAVACDATLILAPGLRVAPSSGSATQPATREAVQGLIAALLDEELLRRGMRQGIRFERAMIQELVEKQGAGTWVIRPLVATQVLYEHRAFDAYLDATALRSKPEVRALIETRVGDDYPHAAGGRGAVPRYSRWFGERRYTDRYFETHFRVTAERRMAAISLAAQIFRADHGRWPASLDELVPAYLPAVPRDPFTLDQPFGYVIRRGALPGGLDRPMLISRSGDTDIGPYPEPMYSWEHDRRPPPARREIWQYRDLARFVPAPPAPPPTTPPAPPSIAPPAPASIAPPASTQAVDDQP